MGSIVGVVLQFGELVPSPSIRAGIGRAYHLARIRMGRQGYATEAARALVEARNGPREPEAFPGARSRGE